MEISSERRYAEEVAVGLEAMGLPRAYGKLLGWLLICDPPSQSSAELAQALDLSKSTVSTGTRMLENAGLIRRVPAPGRRGNAFEMTDDAIMRAVDAKRFRQFQDMMQRGLDLLGGDDTPRARRLKVTRDFYAFIDHELPKLVERFEREQAATPTGLGDRETVENDNG